VGECRAFRLVNNQLTHMHMEVQDRHGGSGSRKCSVTQLVELCQQIVRSWTSVHCTIVDSGIWMAVGLLIRHSQLNHW
jgi:hypothetical protein